jgi:DNA gyrase subunit B
MLSDCVSTDPSSAELYIVGGDVVGTLVKSTRDRYTQGVLVLGQNIEGLGQASLEEALDSEEFKALVAALGIGICLCGEGWLPLNFLRYGRIILVTEETPSGISFRTAVLSLLHRFMGPVITSGIVSTSCVSPQALTSETEFEETVTNPLTRSLSPVR